MSLDNRMKNLFPFHSFSAQKAPAPLCGRGSVLLREFFFYFFERHFERMPA